MNNLRLSNPEFTQYHWHVIHSLQELTKEQQERLFQQADTPFNQYEFLLALEQSGSIGEDTGWLSHHFVLMENEMVLGLMICYQKKHSYGEYVFDWSWADAYHRNGIHYYPKLLMAIPFSPVPCKKWLSDSGISESKALSMLLTDEIEHQFTGVHYLFPQVPLSKQLNNADFIERQGHQFHWFNEAKDGSGQYRDFEHFLTQLSARKRKNVKKERSQISQTRVQLSWRRGNEISEYELKTFYQYYQDTYAKRGMHGYLTERFFQQIFNTMSEAVRLLVCYVDDKLVATALYFKSDSTLYGRYWGSNNHYDLLHFEACYYQGIEFCISNDLTSFNPGTQGEHKIARGFEPTLTFSYHHLFLAPFQEAIGRFCHEEAMGNDEYMAACSERLPFKCQ